MISSANIHPALGKKHISRKSIFLNAPRAVLSSPFVVIRAFFGTLYEYYSMLLEQVLCRVSRLMTEAESGCLAQQVARL